MVVPRKKKTQGLLRVVLVDDHEVVRRGLRSLIDSYDDLTVVGEAGTAKEGVRRVGYEAPDVVVMDVRLPDGSGVEACQEIVDRWPDVGVLILTSFADEEALMSAIMAGAAGYILKDSAPEQLVEAVHAVLNGKTYLSPAITGLVVAQYINLLTGIQASGGPGKLTEEEQTYIQLIGEGCDPGEIAEHLAINEAQVNTLEQAVLEKFQLSSPSELVEYAGAKKWFAGQEGIEAAIQQAITSGQKRTRQPEQQPLIEPLTNRELDVLELLAKRFYDKEIADKLSVSIPTVKTHISHILQKLAVGNRRAAAEKARELGLIE